MAAADVHGLTHIALAVRDLDRTVDFYTRALGLREGGARSCRTG